MWETMQRAFGRCLAGSALASPHGSCSGDISAEVVDACGTLTAGHGNATVDDGNPALP